MKNDEVHVSKRGSFMAVRRISQAAFATSLQEFPNDLLPLRVLRPVARPPPPPPLSVIDLISSDNDSGDEADLHRKRVNTKAVTVLPLGFLDPLPQEAPPEPMAVAPLIVSRVGSSSATMGAPSDSKQFWKAGDYERGPDSGGVSVSAVGIDHVRVHPKFLHSNATVTDVIVFSLSPEKDESHSQSIGMLSYTFLRNTEKKI